MHPQLNVLVLALVLIMGCSDRAQILESDIAKANSKITELENTLKTELERKTQEEEALRTQSQELIAKLKADIESKDKEIATLKDENAAALKQKVQVRSVRRTEQPSKGPALGVSVTQVVAKKVILSQKTERIERKIHIYSPNGKYEWNGKRVNEDPYETVTRREYGYEISFTLHNLTAAPIQVSVSAGMDSKQITVPAKQDVNDKISAKPASNQKLLVAANGKQEEFSVNW